MARGLGRRLGIRFDDAVVQASEQVFEFGGGRGRRDEGGDGGEGAEGGVFDEVFDGLGGCGGGGSGGQAREAERGYLQAVEQDTGAARGEIVGGDAFEDLADGGLDAGAVGDVGGREDVGGEASFAGGGGLDGAAGGVVVVAEGLVAEAGAAATVAVGEDVAALEAGVGGGGWHGESPAGGLGATRGFGAKVFYRCRLGADLRRALEVRVEWSVKDKSPGWPGLCRCFCFYFKYSGWGK